MKKAKLVTKDVQEWVDSWQSLLTSKYININKNDYNTLVKISAIICLMDEQYQSVTFWAVANLLVGDKRKPFWSKTVEALPTDPNKLLCIVKCINYYEKLAKQGKFQPFRKARMNPASVVETMAVIGDSYKAYLDLYADSYYTYPAKVFSPELINEAAKKLRGAFGRFSDQHADYVNALSELD